MTNRIRARLRLAAAGALLATAISASAQTYSRFEDERSYLRRPEAWRVGPFYVSPALRLDGLGYDDNVYFSPEAAAPRTDYTGAISPEAKASLLVGRTLILSFTENPEYRFYLRETRLRTFSNSWAASARLRLVRFLNLRGEVRDQNRVRRVLNESSLQIRDRSRRATGTVFFETVRGTTLALIVERNQMRYRSLDGLPLPSYASALDRDEKTFAAELSYPVFTDSSLFARVSSDDYRFLRPESYSRDAVARDYLAGFRFPVAGRARGRLSLGLRSFKPRLAGRTPYRGLLADTDLDFRSGAVGVRVAYSRNTYFSYLADAYYYVEDAWTPRVSLYVTPTVRLDAGYELSSLEYPEPYPVPGGLTVHRVDTFRNPRVGLTFRIQGTVGLSLAYNFYRRTSNVTAFNVRRNFIGADLVFDF